MEKPSIKKTLTGYMIRHQCACGEMLLNKLREAGESDVCPACRRSFIVPCKALAEEMLKKSDKRSRDSASDSADKERWSMPEGEPVPEPPPFQPRATDAGRSRDRTAWLDRIIRPPAPDESVLRKLSDVAAGWVTRMAWLNLFVAIAIQLALIAGMVLGWRVGALNFAMTWLLFGLYTFLVVGGYYLSKVVLGIFAALLLMERNTRR